MRIVVSGTHAIGKSTLIGDFAASHPEYEVLPDPFELVDTAADEPDASTYLAQLRLSADRLVELSPADRVIAERGPLDFLAYLAAMDHLRRIRLQEEVRIRAAALIAQAMCAVDLLVVLPATGYDDFRAPEDEDPELRQAMNDALLDLSRAKLVPRGGEDGVGVGAGWGGGGDLVAGDADGDVAEGPQSADDLADGDPGGVLQVA
ncbi:hypothetical protein MTsN4n12_31400 [Microbacterium sp. MTN4-12]